MTESSSGSRRAAWLRLAKVAFGVAVLVFGVVFVASRWDDVRDALSQASWGWVVLALATAVLAQECAALAFRSVLAGVAKPLPVPDTNRVFFVSQLGKYIPGSVWPIVAVTEMCRRFGIARRAAAVASVLALVFSLALGAVLGIVLVLISLSGGAGGLWWALLALPVAIALVHPAVIEPSVNALLRLVRREPIELNLRGATLWTAIGWQLAAWLGLGLQCWALVVALGGPVGSSVLPAIGGFALAYTAGTAFVPAPAGAGVREAVLTLALAGVITANNAFDHNAVIVVVLLSRVLLAVVDFGLAGVAVLHSRLRGVSPAELVEPAPSLPSSDAPTPTKGT